MDTVDVGAAGESAMVVGSGPGAMGALAATVPAPLVLVGTGLAPENWAVVGLKDWLDAAPLATAVVGLGGEEGGGGGGDGGGDGDGCADAD